MDTMAICPGLMTDKIRSNLFVQPQAAHNWQGTKWASTLTTGRELSGTPGRERRRATGREQSRPLFSPLAGNKLARIVVAGSEMAGNKVGLYSQNLQERTRRIVVSGKEMVGNKVGELAGNEVGPTLTTNSQGS